MNFNYSELAEKDMETASTVLFLLLFFFLGGGGRKTAYNSKIPWDIPTDIPCRIWKFLFMTHWNKLSSVPWK